MRNMPREQEREDKPQKMSIAEIDSDAEQVEMVSPGRSGALSSICVGRARLYTSSGKVVCGAMRDGVAMTMGKRRELERRIPSHTTGSERRICEILIGVMAPEFSRTDNRLERIEANLLALNGKSDQIEADVAALNDKTDQIVQTLDQVVRTLNQIQTGQNGNA